LAIFKSIRRHSLALLFGLAAQSPAVNAAILSLEPGNTLASDAESVAIDLVVSDLGSFGPDSLGVFDLDVGYDPLALSFVDYSLGGFLGDVGLGEALDLSGGDIGGVVDLFEVSLLSSDALDALQPREFVLATLNFSVLDLDVGEFTELSMLPGAVLGDGPGQALDITETRSATVEGRATVPVPATTVLLLLALFGLRATRRTMNHCC